MARGSTSRGTSMGPSEALAGMVKARAMPKTPATRENGDEARARATAPRTASAPEQKSCKAMQASRILRRS